MWDYKAWSQSPSLEPNKPLKICAVIAKLTFPSWTSKFGEELSFLSMFVLHRIWGVLRLMKESELEVWEPAFHFWVMTNHTLLRPPFSPFLLLVFLSFLPFFSVSGRLSLFFPEAQSDRFEWRHLKHSLLYLLGEKLQTWLETLYQKLWWRIFFSVGLLSTQSLPYVAKLI